MSHKMIDVSAYQGHPDWEQVKEAGYVGGILRIWSSKGVDTSWEYNYNACGRAGIPRGAYRYSYALTTAQAQAEAQEILRTLQGRKLELGVWLDLEWKNQRALGQTKVKQIANIWMKTIRKAGYECNIYCNMDWYRNVCGGLDARYWIARYPQNDTGVPIASLKPNIGELAWQFSHNGKVPGVHGKVDLNEWYGPLPSPIGHDKRKNPYREPQKVLQYNRLMAKMARESVRWLQWELREAGYQLQVDGKFGPQTDLALRAFQAAHGLVIDGKCGPATRAALISA